MINSGNISILSTSDLIMVFLVRDDGSSQILPTVQLNEIGVAVEECVNLGIPAVKLFASSDTRDCIGSRGTAPDSLMIRAIKEVKTAYPSVTVITETCLCSYTDSGECHLLDRNGRPDRLATIEAITEQAVAQAAAGANVVGPAAMISGSVSRIRRALNDTGHAKVQIMPHLIFDSRLYDTYRQSMDTAPTSGERRVFQIDPARPEAAMMESLLFVNEGADMLLLEPAPFCMDILIMLKQACPVTIAPFSVSGEYLRFQSVGDSRLLIELFTMLKRAGADQIITYAAADIARSLQSSRSGSLSSTDLFKRPDANTDCEVNRRFAPSSKATLYTAREAP
jgi:porphobilinogen synthase